MKQALLSLAFLLVAGTAGAQHMHGGGQAPAAFTATPAFAPDGTLYVVRAGTEGVTVAKSADLGRSFSPPVVVMPDAAKLDWGPDARARIVVDGKGGLVVTFAIFQDQRFNGRA